MATVLDPMERECVETAAGACFRAVHAQSVGEARRVLRERPVCAVLFSTARVPEGDMSGLERLIRDFPGIPLIALLTERSVQPPERLLRLGASGVKTLVDVRRRDGWRRLREIVEETTPVQRRIFARLQTYLDGTSLEARDVLEAIVWLAPVTATVRELALRLGVTPSTFMSRFFRARLPSPKQYLSGLRLVHAAALFETPGLSISDVAYRLDYSSPQSFGRHVRSGVGVTAGEFRRRYTFPQALDDFVERMIVPYQAQLRAFKPK